MRILLAEDEHDLNLIITQKLTSDGYSVDSCFDGEAAMDYLSCADYDAVILDIMMPKADGLAVLRQLRQAGKATPVMFLTARDAIADRVKGLDSGANDYLVKPFSFEELSARLRAMTRSPFGMTSNTLSVADLTLDCASHTVQRGGEEILSQRICPAGISDAQPRHRALPGQNRKPHLELRLQRRHQCSGRVYQLPAPQIDEGRPNKLIHTVRGSGYVLREER